MVYVCRGSSCRKQNKSYDRMRSLCADGTEYRTVRCQKICKGAVVGTVVGGRLEWFAKVGRKGLWRSFSEAVSFGRLSKELAKRRVQKRAGILR